MSSPSRGFMFDVKPSRVSLVKHPANKRRFLVMKAQEDIDMDEIIQIITETESENESDLIEALKSADKDAGTIQAAVSISRLLSAFSDSLTDEDFQSLAKSIGWDATPETEEVVEEVEAVEEDVEEEVEKADEVADEPTEEVEAVEEVETPEEIVKSDSETDDRIAELQSKIDELEASRRRNDFATMVKGLVVGKPEDELVEILVKADDAGQDVAPLVETWKTASAAVKSALTEIGSEMPGVVGEDTYGSLENEVARIAKDEGVSITKAWALLQDRNPHLIEEYYKN